MQKQSMSRKWWVSCPKFTVHIETDEDGVITVAAPIVRSFIGQSVGELTRWARSRFGSVEVAEYFARPSSQRLRIRDERSKFNGEKGTAVTEYQDAYAVRLDKFLNTPPMTFMKRSIVKLVPKR